MRIIKVSAIDSTNSYLRKMSNEEFVKDYTIIVTDEQKKGRGQMGTIWSSEKGKNLTFSVFKELSSLAIEYSFYVSIVTSLSIIKALKEVNIPNLKIKWPNDILSEKNKVCGILIENVIKNSQLSSCIIGVGLNVNQTQFKKLPKASSLKLITGKHFGLDELLTKIINQLKHYFTRLDKGELTSLKQEYEDLLFRKNKPSTFKNAEGKMFSGFIKGISDFGKLTVLLEDDITKEFGLKEITLLY